MSTSSHSILYGKGLKEDVAMRQIRSKNEHDKDYNRTLLARLTRKHGQCTATYTTYDETHESGEFVISLLFFYGRMFLYLLQ